MPGQEIIIDEAPWSGDIGGSGEDLPNEPIFYIGILLLVIVAAGAIMMALKSSMFGRVKNSLSALLGS